MNCLEDHEITCPYCGEKFEVLIDMQDMGQQYIEDCQVCCRPITFSITEDAQGQLNVSVHDENDVF